MQQESFHINNKTGIHARPAALLVRTAARFQSKIVLMAGEKKADAHSLLAIMGLGAGPGSDIMVAVDGPDEAAAMAAIRQLLTEQLAG